MFNIKDRYISLEILKPFVLIVITLTFIFILGNLFKLVKLVVNQGLGLMALLKLIATIIPIILVYVLPISFFVAVLVAYNRLSGDREIIAFKASGLSLKQLAMPAITFSIIPFLATLFLTMHAFPWAKHNFKVLLYDLLSTKAHLVLKEKTFMDEFEGITIFIDQLSVNGREMKGIFIVDERDERSQNIITSRNGSIHVDSNSRRLILRLTRGHIHNKGEKEGQYREASFKSYDINLTPKEAENPTSQKKDSELFFNELYEKIEKIKETGGDANPHIVELYKRVTIPFATLIFTIIGVSLGSRWNRSGRLGVYTIALVVVMLYYILSTLFESLGNEGRLNPYLAVWVTNGIFGVFALYSFYRSSKEQPLFKSALIEKSAAKSLKWLKETASFKIFL